MYRSDWELTTSLSHDKKTFSQLFKEKKQTSSTYKILLSGKEKPENYC